MINKVSNSIVSIGGLADMGYGALHAALDNLLKGVTQVIQNLNHA